MVHRFIKQWIGQSLRRKISRTGLGDLTFVHLHSVVQQRTAIHFEVEWMLHFVSCRLMGDFLQWGRWNAYGGRGRCIATRWTVRGEHLLAWAGARSNRRSFRYIGGTQDNAFGTGAAAGKLRIAREKWRILWQSFDLQDRIGQFLLQFFSLNRAITERLFVRWSENANLFRELQNTSLLLFMTFWLSRLLVSQIIFPETDKQEIRIRFVIRRYSCTLSLSLSLCLVLLANKIKFLLSTSDKKRIEAA